MNTWWSNIDSENLWVEITDRSDLGKNIIAPIRAQKGKITPGYELLKHVSEGDLVFHWWMRPKDKELRGFYGYSRVVGTLQEGLIPWKSRGRYASTEPVGRKPATYWNLDGFTEFERPILIGDVNLRKLPVLELIEKLESDHGKPIYFPFCERQGKLAVNQTYFAKLPIAFLEVMKLEELDSVARQFTSKKNSPKITPINKKQLTSGLSRQTDPLKRITVEKYAVNLVRDMLVKDGYDVEEFGKPFDLLAVKDGEILKVEVKGKQQQAVSVEVTVNEVEIARNVFGEYRTLLAVVDEIKLLQEDGKWKATEGRVRLWWDLILDEESLFPSKFVYILPQVEKPRIPQIVIKDC